MLGKVGQGYSKIPKIGKIAIWLAAVLCAANWSSDAAISKISKQDFGRGSEIGILLNFEQNLIRYSHSDRFKSDNVIVGPSYAAMLGEIGGSYNLGITSGFKEETNFVIENFCRDEDKILYFLNLWEAEDFRITGIMRLLARDRIRPEIKNRLMRKKAIIKWWCQGEIEKITGRKPEETDETDFQQPTGYSIPVEDVSEICGDEFWINRRTDIEPAQKECCLRTDANLIVAFGSGEKDFSEIAEYYRKLQEDHNNILYVFLPVMPLQKHPSNQRLNSLIEMIQINEKNLLDRLKNENVRYISLEGVLGPADFMDIIHPNELGESKIEEFLKRKEVL